MKFKQCLKSCFMSIGAIVGAGFISGKEIVFYYAKFSLFGYFLVFLSSILFGLITYVLLKTEIKNSNFFKVFKFCCYFIFCLTMFAGIRSVFSNFISSKMLCEILIIAVYFLVFLWVSLKFNNLAKVNSILVFVMILFIFVASALFFLQGEKSFIVRRINGFSVFKGVVLALNYVCFNCLLAEETISNCGKELNKRECVLSSILISVFVCACLTAILSVCLTLKKGQLGLDMPFIFSVINENIFLKIAGVVVILIAILTSIISVLFALKKFISQMVAIKEKYVVLCILIIIYFLSFISFSNLVEKVYPVVGFFAIFYYFLKLTKIPRLERGNSKTII